MDIYAHFHNNSLTNTGLHHSSSISRQGVIAKPGGQRTGSLPQKGGIKAERSGLPHSPKLWCLLFCLASRYITYIVIYIYIYICIYTSRAYKEQKKKYQYSVQK